MPRGADPPVRAGPPGPAFHQRNQFHRHFASRRGRRPQRDPRTRGSVPQGNPPMSQPRIAVIGAGAFGQNHCRVVHESPRAQLVAIVDTDAAGAEEAAARYQAVALTDARDLPGKIDADIVAAPTTFHADIGCYLLEAGIDVLVEKPIARDLASADRLIDRKSTRLNSSHLGISYAVFCLKK